MAIGDSLARCRISSEYALPMPLKSRGSVSARLSVWFSLRNRAANCARLDVRTSRPPGSCCCSCSSPCTRCSEARRLVPASVRVSVPLPNCRRASTARFGGAVPRSYQCRRPAIMRWNTSHNPPSSPIASRLPSRRRSVTRRCSASWIGGTALRSTNGETICTRSRRSPTMRCCNASRYTVRSGSSGIGPRSLPRTPQPRAGIRRMRASGADRRQAGARSRRERGRASVSGGSQQRRADHAAILHHECDILQRVDVCQRVACDRDQIGVCPGRHGTELAPLAEKLGTPRGGGLYRLHRYHAELDHAGKLLGDRLRPGETTHIGAEGDLDPGPHSLLEGHAVDRDTLAVAHA